MPNTVIDRVIFSVAIVYSETLFVRIQEMDQQIVISILSIILSVFAIRLHSFFKNFTGGENSCCMWYTIVGQWLEILQMITTFIAIHSLVDVVNTLIEENERFYHEALLFPVITLLGAVAIVSITEQRFFGMSTKEKKNT